MAAIHASHPGESAVQVPAIQVPMDHIRHIGPPPAVNAGIAIIPKPFELFEVRLHAPVVVTDLGVSRPVGPGMQRSRL